MGKILLSLLKGQPATTVRLKKMLLKYWEDCFLKRGLKSFLAQARPPALIKYRYMHILMYK